MKNKNLEDLKCEDCCYWCFSPKEEEETKKCRLYIDHDDYREFPMNEEILHRKKTEKKLDVCIYYLDKRTSPAKTSQDVLYEAIEEKKEALEKMANDIVELQSKKDKGAKALKKEYRKRLKDLNKEIINYNRDVKEKLSKSR